MNRRRFIYCAATGLMVPYVRASTPIPFSFFKPGASVATFGPASLSNLVAWWKADSFPSSLAEGTPIGDGGHEWIDSSGNGHTATGSSTSRPTYSVSEFAGGMPSVHFEVTNHSQLTFSAINSLAGDFTFFAVTKGATANSSMLLSDIAQFHMGFNWAGANQLVASAGGSPFPSLTFSTAAANARLNVFGRTGSTLKFYENNGVDHSTGTTSSTFSGMDTLGSYSGGGFDFTGGVGEVCIYSDIKTQTEVQNLYTNYFKSRWTLP